LSAAAREFLRRQTGIAGMVYVIDADHGVKVGVTRWADPEVRQRSIECTAGMPMPIIRAWSFGSYALACRVEKAAHAALADTRTIGEWFHCHPLEACDAVARIIRDIQREKQVVAA
jgi:hypothetical protein